MTGGILELAIVVSIAAVLGIIMRLLRQPVILAYLATGAVIGFFGFTNLADQETFKLFSDLGIMFLLFLVGMEINYTSLRYVGKAAVTAGVAQIAFTFLIGLGIAKLFGFALLPASYIAIALTFSSTIIIVKLLSEKRDLHSLYGKVSLGILLVQDVVAIMLLIVLAGVGNGQGLIWSALAGTVAKSVLLLLIMLFLGRKILPLIFDRVAHSPELLFLVSLAWVFIVAAGTASVGLSIEIGGFLAGLALANSSESFQIAHRIRSLRDFFILIFFVLLGASVNVFSFHGLSWQIIVFSLFVLIGNPLIVLIIMGSLGYRKRTSFLTGVTVAQISEFSLILVALGLKLGHIDAKVVSLITIVGLITITLSTYLILYADQIFSRIFKFLSLFERKRRKKEDEEDKISKPIVLIGAHRIGRSIAANLPKNDLLIIDFDPDVINTLRRYKYHYLFGDVADPEIFEQANLSEAHLIISTIPNLEDNLALLEILKRHKKNRRMKIILRGQDEKEAEALYEQGADYVLLPYFTAGQYLARAIAVDPELKHLDQLKKRDLEIIKRVREQI